MIIAAKFLSGVLSALSAMIQLEIPHINVLTKMDLYKDHASHKKINKYLIFFSLVLFFSEKKKKKKNF